MDYHGLRVVADISRLRDRADERGEAGAALVCQLVIDGDGLRVIEVGVVELGGPHQSVVARLPSRQVGYVMEHQDAPAASIGAHLESGAMRRERIGPHRPRLRDGCGAPDEPVLLVCRKSRVERNYLVVSFVVVEHHLEQPRRLRQVRLYQSRYTIAVAYALEIAAGRPRPIALVRLAAVHVRIILGGVLEDESVALVVVALAGEPAEDAGGP